jgi:hypothetical protein
MEPESKKNLNKKDSHLQALIAQQTITLNKLLISKYVRSFGETKTLIHFPNDVPLMSLDI